MILTPGQAATYAGITPIVIEGYAHSSNDVRTLSVTIDGTAIYSLTR